jgi:hypothetical protein
LSGRIEDVDLAGLQHCAKRSAAVVAVRKKAGYDVERQIAADQLI